MSHESFFNHPQFGMEARLRTIPTAVNMDATADAPSFDAPSLPPRTKQVGLQDHAHTPKVGP